ncbi:hypothetical protein N7G274_007764 [Stereocaulon virgatum]|uniref:Uncharacterized protein n=1 Tax=Stereocaulon virgatum TaxID=373712 RepID=A0ABR4A0M8_9LECA
MKLPDHRLNKYFTDAGQKRILSLSVTTNSNAGTNIESSKNDPSRTEKPDKHLSVERASKKGCFDSSAHHTHVVDRNWGVRGSKQPPHVKGWPEPTMDRSTMMQRWLDEADLAGLYTNVQPVVSAQHESSPGHKQGRDA